MNNKKIALLTIHDTLNYGSLLQTYSTYKAIEQLGCDVTLLDYKCEKIAKREAVPRLRECRGIKDIVKYFMRRPAMKKKKEEFNRFSRENMRLSEPYYNGTIKTINSSFDAYIVGSDIVWGTKTTGRDFTYFLDFVSDSRKKISFSSSVGTEWDDVDKTPISGLLNRFDAISVREQLAAEWVSQLVDKDVSVTCDPTMLWDAEYWRQFINKKYIPKDKYVLVYLCTSDHKNIDDAIRYAKERNLQVYYINFGKPFVGTKTIRPSSISEWITLIANAQTVFSASYHGLLYALYFQRNVFYYNRGNTSRMISFGCEFNIKNREGLDENIINDIPIDFDFINCKMKEKREFSLQFLKNQILNV